MFDINRIVLRDVNAPAEACKSRYVILTGDTSRKILMKIALYETLYILRCRNIISTNQFRSVRGQIKYNPKEVETFVKHTLISKYGEMLLLNNKYKEMHEKYINSLFILDTMYYKLYKINTFEEAVDIRLGE